MRDPARIDRILELLREAWHAHPDWRLAQLVVNVIKPAVQSPQVFYQEDEVIENGLIELLNRTRH
jgi:uncharacterized protein YihD (DUF1040 family)